MEYKKINLSDLQPNLGQIPGVPRNPRKWTHSEVKNLAKSMTETPELTEARGAIVVPFEGKYIILGGNMRYEAAKLNAWPSLPCALLPADLPAAKMKEIVLKDNSSFGEWNFTLLAGDDWAEFDLKQIGIDLPKVELQKEQKKAKDDAFNVTRALARSEKNPKTQPGDVYRLGTHRLMCGDSTDPDAVSKLCDGITADMIMTDPPYNVDYSSKNEMLNYSDKGCRIQDAIENDCMSPAAFREFLLKAFTNMAQNVKAGGAAYVFHASREVVNFVEAFTAAGFEYKQMLIWVKNNMVLGRQDYQWKHEPCIYGWKAGGSHYFINDRSQMTVEDFSQDFATMSKAELVDFCIKFFSEERTPATVTYCDKPLRNGEHPTMKPVPLLGKYIVNSTRKGEVVLDLFGGSGSTLIACEQLDRSCFTMEYDPVYCDVIVERWEKLTGQKAVKL